MEKPDGLPLPSGKAPLFGWAPSQRKAGEEFQGEWVQMPPSSEGAAPSSSQAMLVCPPLPLSEVFCQKQHFRKLKKKKKRGVGRGGRDGKKQPVLLMTFAQTQISVIFIRLN